MTMPAATESGLWMLAFASSLQRYAKASSFPRVFTDRHSQRNISLRCIHRITSFLAGTFLNFPKNVMVPLHSLYISIERRIWEASLFTPTNTPLIPIPSKPPKADLVLFVGFPCLGKTLFYRRHFWPNGYIHINQDILKRREKCIQAVEDALKAGQSCVVGKSEVRSRLNCHWLL